MNQRSKFLIISTLLLLFNSCARVGTPTGGPEDETPPELIVSNPENGTTNFAGNIIQLTFDERIITRSIETDLILTPKPEGTFRARVNKNILSLTFTEPFRENTTYNLSFGSTIQDITNNNPAEGVVLSFSTGDYIDSLSIQGKVLNLYNQEPIENLLVSLYSEDDSLDVLSGPASYYNRTDSAGNYRFTNLPHGKFRVYATRDKNNNSQADSENEKYGFYKDTLSLSSPASNIDFTVQSLNTSQLRTVFTRTYGTYYDISFNKAVTNFQILEGPEILYDQPEDDKIRFYPYQQSLGDTTQIIYSVRDSLQTTFRDTVGVYFSESKLDRPQFSLEVSPNENQIPPNDTITIAFNKPVIDFNLDSIYFQLDSLNQVPIDPNTVIWNTLNTELKFPIDIVSLLNQSESPNIAMTLGTGTFISADSDSSVQQTKPLSLLTLDDSAIIGGTVQSQDSDIIIQLLDSRTLEVVRSTTDKNFNFQYLSAGRYMVRVIKDINSNGKWDTGNILDWQIPEPVKFYYDDFYKTKVIEVRKNWEQTDINIFF